MPSLLLCTDTLLIPVCPTAINEQGLCVRISSFCSFHLVALSATRHSQTAANVGRMSLFTFFRSTQKAGLLSLINLITLSGPPPSHQHNIHISIRRHFIILSNVSLTHTYLHYRWRTVLGRLRPGSKTLFGNPVLVGHYRGH